MSFTLNSTFGFGGSTDGGGSSLASASNGLSASGTVVVLGQSVGQSGSPAVLLSNREIPLGGFNVVFSGTGNIGVGTTAPNSKLDVTTDGLGVTQTNTSGIVLSNNTAADIGAQQMPPALRFRGMGWKTNATAASQTVDFRLSLLPVQGASAPTSVLLFQSSINGGTYTSPANLTSDGAFTCSNNLTTATSLQVGSAGLIIWASRARMASPADSIITIHNGAATDFNRLQFGGTTASFPSLKRSSTTLQARLADDSGFSPFSCGLVTINGVGEFADNAAAILGGLVTGQVYRTADVMKIVH